MLIKILIILISVVALLIVCWILTEYWLRSVRKLSREKVSNLSIWNRMVFAVEDFFGAVNHKKDFRRMKAGEELSTVQMDAGEETKKTSHSSQTLKSEKEKSKKEKKYNMKVNM